MTEEEEHTCNICLESCLENNKLIKLKCNHEFHSSCIEKWKQYNTCPVCRKTIDNDKPVIKPLFHDEKEDYDLALELSSNNNNSNSNLLDLASLLAIINNRNNNIIVINNIGENKCIKCNGRILRTNLYECEICNKKFCGVECFYDNHECVNNFLT